MLKNHFTCMEMRRRWLGDVREMYALGKHQCQFLKLIKYFIITKEIHAYIMIFLLYLH